MQENNVFDRKAYVDIIQREHERIKHKSFSESQTDIFKNLGKLLPKSSYDLVKKEVRFACKALKTEDYLKENLHFHNVRGQMLSTIQSS